MATGSKLVIVESPTKAKKIGGYLGSGYTVMASVGHIRDLAQPSQVPAAEKAKYGKFGVDIEDGFKPYYIVDGNKKKTVADLKSALKKADTLYLATDEDREGEAIALELHELLHHHRPPASGGKAVVFTHARSRPKRNRRRGARRAAPRPWPSGR